MKQNYTNSIIDFINNQVILKKGNKISSNKIYLLYCFLNDINIKHLNIKTFMPLFLETFEKLNGIKLERDTIRLYKGKDPIRCILDIDLVFTKNTRIENTEEFDRKQTTNLEISPQIKLDEKPLIPLNDVTSASKAELTADFELDKTSKITADAGVISNVNVQKFKNYGKIKDWLKARCINAPGENTFVHLLVEDFVNFVKTKDEINNRSFINHLIRYSEEEWPNSNIKKEDKLRKTNSSYITNLKLKP